MVTVQHRDRARVHHRLHAAPGVDGAGVEPVDIARHTDDAVAVVPGEVGLDQVAGDARALGLVATGGLEDRGNGLPQPPGVDREGVFLGSGHV